jgi:hypothetical protein
MSFSTPVHARAARAAVGLAIATVTLVGACRSPQPERPDGPSSGSAPPSRLPAEAALPKTDLSVRDRSDWRAVLRWPDDCEEAFQASHAGEDGGLVFELLAEGLWVVQVLCAAGSYQPSSVYVRLDERPATAIATVLNLATFQSSDGVSLERIETTEIWGEPFVSAKEQELTVLHLSRQTGDCGIWMRYAIGAGAAELVEAWARLPCPADPEPPVTPAPGRPPQGWTRIPKP